MAGAHGLLCRLTDHVDKKLLDAAGMCRASLGRIEGGLALGAHQLAAAGFELVFLRAPQWWLHLAHVPRLACKLLRGFKRAKITCCMDRVGSRGGHHGLRTFLLYQSLAL